MAAESSASTVWEGNLTRGSGRTTPGSGAFGEVEVTWASRTSRSAGKTSPEELLAAAHAGCLTMGIATELTQAGAPPERLEVSCRIVMDEVEGQGHQIVASHVTVPGEVPADLLERADAACPFSIMLRNAGVEVTITRT